MIKLVALSLLLACVIGSSAHAQAEVPPQELTTRDIAYRSLRGPRAEVISGALIVASSPLVALTVTIFTGPGWFECGFLSEPDPACEARKDREQRSARNLGIGIGAAWAAVGGILLAHGGYNIRQIRMARRSLEFSPTFSQRTAGLQLRF